VSTSPPPVQASAPAPVAAVVLRRVAVRAAAAAATALFLAALVLPWRPPTLCMLRGLTGIPCPFCGGTTAMVELGRGHPLAALAASPLAALGAPAWVLWPAVERRARALLAAAGRRRALVALLVVLGLSWAWQLQRYLG